MRANANRCNDESSFHFIWTAMRRRLRNNCKCIDSSLDLAQLLALDSLLMIISSVIYTIEKWFFILGQITLHSSFNCNCITESLNMNFPLNHLWLWFRVLFFSLHNSFLSFVDKKATATTTKTTDLHISFKFLIDRRRVYFNQEN